MAGRARESRRRRIAIRRSADRFDGRYRIRLEEIVGLLGWIRIRGEGDIERSSDGVYEIMGRDASPPRQRMQGHRGADGGHRGLVRRAEARETGGSSFEEAQLHERVLAGGSRSGSRVACDLLRLPLSSRR